MADEDQSRRKVQTLIELENNIQQLWAEEKLFEQDAPAEGGEEKETYVVTFPYPYVNGRFHLGHAFTVSKAEFALAYERLQGKHCLFPFGMHCTGMPIKAAADKIKREMEDFGNPPAFSLEDQLVGYDWQNDAEWLAKLQIIKDDYKKKNAGGKKKKKKDAAPTVLLADVISAEKRSYFKANVNDALPLTVDETVDEEQARLAKLAQDAENAADPTKSFHSKKSKVSQKGGSMRQWFIMKQLGIADEDIPKFADAEYWLEYFPPLYKTDLTSFGLKIDWRRTFITTDVNPYYDSFVRWQFNQLNAQGKLKFDSRFSIYSPKDGQPCMDHDRSSGEGVLPKEYTLIKMQVPPEEVAKRFPSMEGKKVYLAPATLRPETMYGQTNCWISAKGNYGAFQINEEEVFIITRRSARNLAFQGYSLVPGEVTCLAEMTGQELIGLPLIAPLATTYTTVYVLPMQTVKDTTGTGVVTSVPSDSPDDYVSLMDLKKSDEWRQKLGVQDEWVMPFEPVPIIKVKIGKDKTETDLAAPLMCAELKINGPKQEEQLTIAKKEVYTLGFHEGVMIVGEHAGKPVCEVKNIVRDHLLSTNQAIKYCEPSKEVVSRSGDVCVVALTDQWYINYGESEWKAKATLALERLETFCPETRDRFEKTLDWLKGWACSRSYGLGTYLPWDKQWLIESLSDSTIYMSFYTVAHFLQQGEVNPKKLTVDYLKSNESTLVQPDQLTDEVWSYLFLDAPFPEGTDIDPELLNKMKREFNYWYPVNLRVSGNDLVKNHLTFFLYNHVAIFPEKHWPKGVRTNGFLLLDGEKMSKSTGNFMTLSGALAKFGVDATRFTLADAGDSVDDANFTEETANAAILKLFTQLQWMQDVKAAIDGGNARTGDFLFADSWFDNEMSVTIAAANENYKKTNFRDALHQAFTTFQKLRDSYVLLVGDIASVHADLILRFMKAQVIMLSPICPHWCDHVWRNILGNSGSVIDARWPETKEVDLLVIKQGSFIFSKMHDFQKALEYQSKKVIKATPTRGVVYVASCYPEDQHKVLTVLAELYQSSGAFPDMKAISGALAKNFKDKKKIKTLMKFVMETSEFFKVSGPSALDTTTPIDEVAVITENMGYLRRTLRLDFDLEVVRCDANGDAPEGVDELRTANNKAVTMPGRPSIVFK